VGLRFVHVEPLSRQDDWLDLRLDENHQPPVYLATVRLHRERKAAPDSEHVRDVAPAVLARLSCRSVDDYLEKGLVLSRAKKALEQRPSSNPERIEQDDLVFTLGSEHVATTLAPGERLVYRVAWRGEHALTYWLGRAPQAELCWVSSAFRFDARLRPRAVEHGFSYVPWALEALEDVRAQLLDRPRPLDLGLPLEVTEPFSGT
jgi:hypothetical protein